MSFTFKINEDSLKNVEKSVRVAFDKAISNANMLNEIGKTIADDVREQTRKGKSIPSGLKDFKLLKESWIKRKTRLDKFNETDAAYEEGGSNLTFTGQLLNSFKHKIIGKGMLELFFDGNHKPYKSPTGSPVGKEIMNKDLADYVAKGGRPFVGVRPAIRLRVNRIVKGYIKRALIVARLLKEIDN